MAKAKKSQTSAKPVAKAAEPERRAHTPVSSSDSDRKDSLGNPKTHHIKDAKGKESHVPVKDPVPVGPRGKGAPRESQTEMQQRESDAQRESRLGQGMSNTDQVDSRGERQDLHEHSPQGHDKHGQRLPDLKGKKIEEAPKVIGPRGSGAPQDSHHGSKPAGKEAGNIKGW